MPRLIWTSEALQDVARLHDFLKGKNSDAAKRAVKTIRQSVRLLATHPEAGRPAGEMSQEFREWIIEFGEPVETAHLGAVAADDPMLVFDLTDQIRESIQQTLYKLLMQRRSVFF